MSIGSLWSLSTETDPGRFVAILSSYSLLNMEELLAPGEILG